jgi:hypothetical protein
MVSDTVNKNTPLNQCHSTFFVTYTIKEGGGEIKLPNAMSLRPGLLWLTLNLALVIQCLSRNNTRIFYILRKMLHVASLHCYGSRRTVVTIS